MAAGHVARRPGAHRAGRDVPAWNAERIAGAARAFFDREGRAPSARDWAVSSDQHPSHITVARVFCGRDPWRQLREAAGIEGLDRWAAASEMLATGTSSSEMDELERAFRHAQVRGARQDFIDLARCAIARASTLPRQ